MKIEDAKKLLVEMKPLYDAIKRGEITTSDSFVQKMGIEQFVQGYELVKREVEKSAIYN